MLQEIERKFLIDKLPKLSELDWLETQNIMQVYLATGKDHIRIREVVRGNGIDHILTIKRGNGLVREEMELPIDEYTFCEWKEGLPELKKTRHIVLANGYKTDIDVYHQHNLIVAEVEFPNEYEAKQYKPPIWFGNEVTGIPEYENQYLWKEI